MNPRSKSSAVRFIGAILFLASALALGANPYGSAIAAQKNDQSGGKSGTLASRSRSTNSQDQQQPQSNTRSNRPKPEEQRSEELERRIEGLERRVQASEQQAPGMDPAKQLEQRVEVLEQQIEKRQLFAIIAVGAAVASLIFTLFIFLNRKPRVGDSYDAINHQLAKLTNEVTSLKKDVNGLRQTWGDRWNALRRELSNFVPAESFDAIRRAIERLQSERPFAMTSSRPTVPYAQFAEPDLRGQAPPGQISPIIAVPPPHIKQFADLPDREGTFKEGSLKSKAEWNSLYTLTIMGPDNAIVEIYSNSERFEAAIKAPEQYLSPVCEYENNPSSSARTIRLLSAGRASREGETWKVTQKLKIEFV